MLDELVQVVGLAVLDGWVAARWPQGQVSTQRLWWA
ncbi:hypothetical protein IW245_000100 [Longispora fulva]|uniref:Uncharacterized protein n=1 Tax=Longispora fulva TaxID=619741 RepID=A0A8J7GNL8_9ACTN|nr:hypothetical protein [Longispora fulva]